MDKPSSITSSIEDEHERRIIHAEILSTRTVQTLTLYTIQVTWGEWAWTVERRYNDFVRLDAHLATLQQMGGRAQLPEKGMLGLRKILNINRFRERRLKSLRQYLENIMRLVDEDKSPVAELDAFLGVHVRFARASSSLVAPIISHHLMVPRTTSE